MKSIKFLLPLLAVVLIVTAAFTTQGATAQPKKVDTFFYQYTGTGTSLSDYENPDNWSNAMTENPGGCNGGSVLPCVVSSGLSDKNDFIDDISNNGTGVVNDHIEAYRTL